MRHELCQLKNLERCKDYEEIQSWDGQKETEEGPLIVVPKESRSHLLHTCALGTLGRED